MSNFTNTELYEYWNFCFATAFSYSLTPIPRSLIPFLTHDFLRLYLVLVDLQTQLSVDIDYFGYIPLTTDELILIPLIAHQKGVNISLHDRKLIFTP